MLHALTLALMDSVNLLLIGVLSAMAVMLPVRNRLFSRTASVLILGDWCGVFGLAVVVMRVLDGVGDPIKEFAQSPIFGMILIAAGVLIAALSFTGGSNSQLTQRLLRPLHRPSLSTWLTGFVLGVVQSATSVPFYGGLVVLSASGISEFERYAGLFLYASVALSLPTLSALALGLARHRPRSRMGSLIVYARSHPERVARGASLVVAVVLAALGVTYLV